MTGFDDEDFDAPGGNAARVFITIFIGIFGVIGVITLVFLWTATGFGAPPLFFKLFGSCIAVAFIAFSAFGIYNAWTAKARLSRFVRHTHRFGPSTPVDRASEVGDAPARSRDPSSPDWGCPNCGAGLASDTEISPSGDVKCPFCDQWFSTRR